MWVACQADCIDDQIDLFLPRTPPLIALEDEPGFPSGTDSQVGGRGTPEGRESNTSVLGPTDELPF